MHWSANPKRWSAQAKRYAQRVVDGQIPAGLYVRLGCHRFLNDLKKQKDSSWRWRFDADSADLACFFQTQLLYHEGTAQGCPQVLEPWQCFSICNVFGWVDKEDPQRRRFNYVYEEIPRKNSKSTKMAGVGLYVLCVDPEGGKQVYCGATKHEQAMNVFRPVLYQARNNPFISANSDWPIKYGAGKNNEHVIVQSTDSFFKPLVKTPGDGTNPVLAIVDEYHEHPDDRLYSSMETGMGARKSSILWVITTAGVNTAGPCYDKRDDLIKTLEGTYENDRLFGLIYGIDEDDDWQDFDNWIKANPNYGVSVDPDKLRTAYENALRRPGLRNDLLCKRLNIWNNASAGWMDMRQFRKCAVRDLKLDDFKGCECFIGLDMAEKRDLTAKVYFFPHAYNGRHVIFAEYYAPRATVDLPENEHFRRWEGQGLLSVTKGNITNFHLVRDELIEDSKRFDIQAVGYDPSRAHQIALELQDEGLPVVEYGQRPMNFSEPMAWLDADVYSKAIAYDADDKMLEWMFSNVVQRKSLSGLTMPAKEIERNKIDAVVACIMAKGLFMSIEKQAEPSIEVWGA